VSLKERNALLLLFNDDDDDYYWLFYNNSTATNTIKIILDCLLLSLAIVPFTTIVK